MHTLKYMFTLASHSMHSHASLTFLILWNCIAKRKLLYKERQYINAVMVLTHSIPFLYTVFIFPYTVIYIFSNNATYMFHLYVCPKYIQYHITSIKLLPNFQKKPFAPNILLHSLWIFVGTFFFLGFSSSKNLN